MECCLLVWRYWVKPLQGTIMAEGIDCIFLSPGCYCVTHRPDRWMRQNRIVSPGDHFDAFQGRALAFVYPQSDFELSSQLDDDC